MNRIREKDGVQEHNNDTAQCSDGTHNSARIHKVNRVVARETTTGRLKFQQ